jgi:hypothetical protein
MSDLDIGALLQEVCPGPLPEERPKAVIRITSGHQIQIETWDYNNVGHVRFISLAELRRAVSDLPSDTGWLDAPGQWQVIRCFSSGSRDWRVVWHSPGQHKLFMLHPVGGKQVEITVPLPALVMVYSGKTGYLWASKLTQLDFKKPIELFLAPLPNVDSNAKLCLSEQAKTAFEWWEGVMNADFAKDKAKGVHSKDIRNKLLAVQGKDEYPLKDLIKAEVNLEQVIKSIGEY